jgi:hypothetical protein
MRFLSTFEPYRTQAQELPNKITKIILITKITVQTMPETTPSKSREQSLRNHIVSSPLPCGEGGRGERYSGQGGEVKGAKAKKAKADTHLLLPKIKYIQNPTSICFSCLTVLFG